MEQELHTLTGDAVLFAGKPYCARCECTLRALGTAAVSCDHTSLTIGVDHLSSHAYDDWMVVERELEMIVSRKVTA